MEDNKEEAIPLVSVIIPTYGRSATLGRAIRSVKNQTYKNIEIIVVDDNGKNIDEKKAIQAIIEDFEDVRYITYKENHGGSFARNRGIEVSEGKYISFLDDDDEMLPEKIKLQVERLESCDSLWGASYTRYYNLRKGNRKEYFTGSIEGECYLPALMRSMYIGAGSNLMIRKSVVADIGLFDEGFKRNQDVEYLARIAEKYKIAFVDSVQLIVHYENKTERKKKFTYKFHLDTEMFYRDKFKNRIDKLCKEDQSSVYKYFALERFKCSIGTVYMVETILFLIKNRVSPILLCRYIMYLYDRKKGNKIYGFQITH